MNGLSRKEAQDVLSMAEILEIPGLDMMQGILEGTYPAAPIAKILNYKVHALEKGIVVGYNLVPDPPANIIPFLSDMDFYK